MNKLNQLSQLKGGVWQLRSIGAHSKFNQSDSLSWKLNNGTGTNQIANWTDINNKLGKYMTLPSDTPMTRCPKYSSISSVFNSGYKFDTKTNYKSNQLVKYSDLAWKYDKLVSIDSYGKNGVTINLSIIAPDENKYTIWYEDSPGRPTTNTWISYNSNYTGGHNPQAWLQEIPYPNRISLQVDYYAMEGLTRTNNKCIIKLYGPNPTSEGSVEWIINYDWRNDSLTNCSYTKNIYDESYEHTETGTSVSFDKHSSNMIIYTGELEMTNLRLYWS